MSASLTRRALVGTAPAAVLTATLPALASAHPDAELLALEAQLVMAAERRIVLVDRSDEAYEGYEDPPVPEALLWRQSDCPSVWLDAERLNSVGDPEERRFTYASQGVLEKLRNKLSRWNAVPLTDRGFCTDRDIARVEEIIAGVETWEVERDRLLAACGYTAAEEAHDAQCAVISALHQRIAMTPARTAEGVCVKARAALDASVGDLAFIERYQPAPLLTKADRRSSETAELLNLSAMIDAAKLAAASSSIRRSA